MPSNREAVWLSGYSTTSTLYTYIKKVNAARKQALSRDSSYVTSKATPVYSDSHTIAMRKGSEGAQLVSVFTNSGAGGNASFVLPGSDSGFFPLSLVTDLLSCSVHTTDLSGNLAVVISNGLPKVFYPTVALLGTSLCAPSIPTLTTSFVSATSTINLLGYVTSLL